MSVHSGQLRHRVRFDKRTSSAGTYGVSAGAWTAQFTCWGAITAERGFESVQNQRLNQIQQVQIVVRRNSDTALIDNSWRAVRLLDGAAQETYAIKYVNALDPNREKITIMAESGAADA